MPIEVGIKKPSLGDCPKCGAPLKEFLGMIRCSRGRCDYVESQRDKATAQREEARIQTVGAHLAQEERGRLRGMLPKLSFLGSRGDGNGSDRFLQDMVDSSKDPMENGKAKKKGDSK